jgi:glycosyltransferase involved in cell wall biosynthesis
VFRFPSVRTWVAREYPLALPYIPRLAEKVRDLRLDVIHTHTPFMLGLLGARLARRLDIPLVSTNHTLYTEYVHYFPLTPRSWTRSILIGHLRRYYNRCDGVVAPSRLAARILEGYGVRTPVYVIPTGIELDTAMDEEARARIRRDLGIPADARALLYVGRLAREKNLGLLVKAFERLAVKHDDLYLLIVGGGPYEAGCRDLVGESACCNRVVFAGYIPRNQVAKYYSAGDLFTFPSTTETQGLVICEAMGAGLPCVAVDAGGSPEMVIEGEDGLLAEDDLDDFTMKIDRLISDRGLLRSFSTRAVQNAKRFSPREMALRMLDVYGRVQTGKPG